MLLILYNFLIYSFSIHRFVCLFVCLFRSVCVLIMIRRSYSMIFEISNCASSFVVLNCSFSCEELLWINFCCWHWWSCSSSSSCVLYNEACTVNYTMDEGRCYYILSYFLINLIYYSIIVYYSKLICNHWIISERQGKARQGTQKQSAVVFFPF